MKRLAVLSGAGVSKESGINTFRDSGGLWEQYPVEDVASIEGWHRNPGLVLDFYNARRRDVQHREPNEAHRIIAELEKDFKVTVITQNIDNLHERAGSTDIIHLHGDEPVPMIEKAAEVVSRCDILLVIGTSLAVYPAAGLVGYIRDGVPVYLIDPSPISLHYRHYTQIQDVATSGMRRFRDLILN